MVLEDPSALERVRAELELSIASESPAEKPDWEEVPSNEELHGFRSLEEIPLPLEGELRPSAELSAPESGLGAAVLPLQERRKRIGVANSALLPIKRSPGRILKADSVWNIDAGQYISWVDIRQPIVRFSDYLCSMPHTGKTLPHVARAFRTSHVSHPLRHFPMEGASNLRDIGGIGAGPGFRLRTGLVFRSDDLSHLTDHDLGQLGKLNLRRVVDLRTGDERLRHPDRLPDPSATHTVTGSDAISAATPIRQLHIPIAPHLQQAGRLAFTWQLASHPGAFDGKQRLADHYRTVRLHRTTEIAKLFEQLVQPDALPCLIHCTAGKDRTGLIAALLQRVLGVPASKVRLDYLATNELNAQRSARLLRYLRRTSLWRVSREQFLPMLEAQGDLFDEFFAELHRQFGSVEHYLITGCDVAPETLARLRELLREPDTGHEPVPVPG